MLLKLHFYSDLCNQSNTASYRSIFTLSWVRPHQLLSPPPSKNRNTQLPRSDTARMKPGEKTIKPSEAPQSLKSFVLDRNFTCTDVGTRLPYYLHDTVLELNQNSLHCSHTISSLYTGRELQRESSGCDSQMWQFSIEARLEP